MHVLSCLTRFPHSIIFFFNDTATTEIYSLSLHDALPISSRREGRGGRQAPGWVDCRADAARRSGGHSPGPRCGRTDSGGTDRKSTRLNSSHANISYAVFCLKKKPTAIQSVNSL